MKVKHIGVVCLKLFDGHELVLKDTVYVPFMRRNLVSIFALDSCVTHLSLVVRKLRYIMNLF